MKIRTIEDTTLFYNVVYKVVPTFNMDIGDQRVKYFIIKDDVADGEDLHLWVRQAYAIEYISNRTKFRNIFDLKSIESLRGYVTPVTDRKEVTMTLLLGL